MPVNSPFTFNTFTPEDATWQRREGYEAGYPLPHVLTFQSVIGAAWRTYYHGSHDDAIYNDPEYAIAMQRDPLVMSIIQERCKGTVNRKWHIEVDNEKNPQHKAVADGLRKIVNMMPHKRQMFSYMLEGALWSGRVGSQLKYQDKIIRLPHWKSGQDVEVEVPVPVGHLPIDGDKINYMFDGTPIIQVYNPGTTNLPGAALTMTTQSKALALVGDWRSNFVIHAHEIRDAPFWMAHRAGAVYGVGVRHVIYWLSWLKRELLASILTYAERTGMGLRIWKYQAGNDASKREVQKAAENQTDRTNLLLPVTMAPGGRPVEGVEFIESGSTVSTLLLDILRKFDDDIERYIIGQSLSSGADATGLGSSGIAGFVATTKDNLCEYDADNFGESLTSDMVRKMGLWVYPKDLVEDANPRFAYQVSKPSPAEKLAAARQVFDMGAHLSEKSLLEDAGQPKPEEGENILSLEKQQQQQMQLETQAAQAQAAMGQPPGGMPGTGEEQAEPTEGDYNDVMKELVGEDAQQQLQQARNGQPLRYLRGKPGERHPARRHASKAHRHLGDNASLHLHHYLEANKGDPRLHNAASLIRHHLEPDEQDYESVRQLILGAKPGNPVRYDRSGSPDMFAALQPRIDPSKTSDTRMPGILVDLAKIEKTKPKKAKLPHEEIAEQAARTFGEEGAKEKVAEVKDKLAQAHQADPEAEHHEMEVANRVMKLMDDPSWGAIGKVREAGKSQASGNEKDFFQKIWPKFMKETGNLQDKRPGGIEAAATHAAADVLRWAKDNPRFLDYYTKDWNATRKLLNGHFGKVTDTEFKLFRVLTGLSSANTALPQNMTEALQTFDLFREHGNLDAIEMGIRPGTISKKTGKMKPDVLVVKNSPIVYAGSSQNNKARAIKAFESKLKDLGGDVDETVDFFNEYYTPGELHNIKKGLLNTDGTPLYKGGVGDVGTSQKITKEATGRDDGKMPGWFMFGPKIGAYVQNALGDHRFTTTDVWEGRFIRSYFKTLWDENTGLPQGQKEHEIMSQFQKNFNKVFAKQYGQELAPSAMQAIRWFYILDAVKQAGYTKSITSDTISAYTSQAIKKGRARWTDKLTPEDIAEFKAQAQAMGVEEEEPARKVSRTSSAGSVPRR